MKILLIIAASLILSACATATPTYAPDGGHAYSIDCSKGNLTWGSCYEKAGEICKEKGYTVVAGGSDQSTAIVANNGGLFGASSATRSLVIKCKP